MNIDESGLDRGKDSDAEVLALRLREARDYVGLSQETVAEHLGISRPAVSAIERGTRKVSGLELKRLAGLYRRPITFFLDVEAESEVVLEADSFAGALFRATQDLEAADRYQVLSSSSF